MTALPLGTGPDQISEGELQQLIHDHPACLPITEIDALFAVPVPICMELSTPAGSIDNLMVTASGLPVLVECKLWRNPEGRREVVGQILDYAKELSRWSASDLQREVARRVKREGNPILHLVREAGHDVDEISFNDALTHNLRRGRFLLLIVGDGIREGVEAIAEYLQVHAGLHFSLGLVELPIYILPGGDRLVVPRVLARTQLVTRTVVAVPEGHVVLNEQAQPVDADIDGDELTADRVRFWTDFIDDLSFDDPDQPRPKVSRQGYIWISMPVPRGACWLTVFRNMRDNKVGVFLSYTRSTPGERVVRRLVEDWSDIRAELGGSVVLGDDKLGRPIIQDELGVTSLAGGPSRSQALDWLRLRTNDFVNVLRPRIKSALAEFSEE